MNNDARRLSFYYFSSLVFPMKNLWPCKYIIFALFVVLSMRPSFALNFDTFSQSFPLEITKAGGVAFCSSVAIHPQIILTAAHCVEGASQINLVLGHSLEEQHARFTARSWKIHPSYDPQKSNFHFDIARIILKKPLPTHLPYRKLSLVVEKNPIVRVGFGGRDGLNKRTLISGQKVIYYNRDYFELDDHYSVMGDSGGPIFQMQNGEYVLIGIHSTREGSDKTYGVHPFFRF